MDSSPHTPPAPAPAPTPIRATHYPAGTFSWTDLASPDPERARDFLCALFGWTPREIATPSGPYIMLELHGGAVAAVSGHPSGEHGSGASWTHYVSVDDADAVASRAAELGGTVAMAPMDVTPVEEAEREGRMALLTDPAGASVALWQPGAHIGAAYVNAPGCMAWNELVLPAGADRAAAEAFYRDLFGWEIDHDESDYGLIRNRGRLNGGTLAPGMAGDRPPFWHVYFAVADADRAAERARQLGGAVLEGPRSMGEMGRFAVLREPTGSVFTAVAFAGEVDPPPGGDGTS